MRQSRGEAKADESVLVREQLDEASAHVMNMLYLGLATVPDDLPTIENITAQVVASYNGTMSMLTTLTNEVLTAVRAHFTTLSRPT